MDLITIQPTTKPREVAPATTLDWVGASAITGRTRVYGGTVRPEVSSGSLHVSMTMPDFAPLYSGGRSRWQLPKELDRQGVWLGLGVLIAVITVALGLLLVHPFGGAH
jgi:hypothetical protein